MKGDRHDTIQDIQREYTAVLNAIPQKEYSDLSIDSSYVLIQRRGKKVKISLLRAMEAHRVARG
jgi:hypothetical protein